jgi:hypothetical protein
MIYDILGFGDFGIYGKGRGLKTLIMTSSDRRLDWAAFFYGMKGKNFECV